MTDGRGWGTVQWSGVDPKFPLKKKKDIEETGTKDK